MTEKLSRGARDPSLQRVPYLGYTSNKGSRESGLVSMLIIAFAGGLNEKYQNLMIYIWMTCSLFTIHSSNLRT